MDPQTLLNNYRMTKKGTSSPQALLDSYRASKQIAPAPTIPQGDGMLMGMAKSLVTAPATMIARPFQAIQSAVQLAGMDIKGNEAKSRALSDQAYQLALSLRTAPEENKPAIRAQIQDLQNQARAINNQLAEGAKWQPTSGGIIAPAPQNMADVKKDVGRAIQTVALGVPGAPLASGAAFGVGSSLEQGNDLFSWDTAGSALLGLGFAKGLDKWGKPVINYVGGKLAGFAPKTLKDIAAKGEQAVLDFAKNNKLLNAVTKPTAPLAKAITTGAEAFDTTVNKGASSLWQGTKDVIKSQYPDVRKNYETKFENTEVKRFTDAIKSNDKNFYNSRKVISDSGLSIDDVENTLKDTKTYAMHNTDGTKYQTMGAADEMTDKAMNNGPTILRPALKATEGSVERVTLNDFRGEVIKALNSKSYAKFSPQDKANIAEAIVDEYRVGSPTSKAFEKNGYTLEDLYNAQLKANEVVYSQSSKTGITSLADSATAARKKIEAEVFKKFLVDRAPAEIGITAYLKEQQKRFITANVLRALDGKPIPRNLYQKAARTTARLFGGALGMKLGGPFAIFPGMQAGILADDMFMKATNPVKVSLLKDLQKSPVEAYEIMKDYVTKSEFNRLWMKTPRLTTSTAIPMGPYTPPVTPSNTLANDFTQNSQRLFNTKQLGAPESRIILPNTQGTPNQQIAPYPSNPEVGGMRQRIFKGKK